MAKDLGYLLAITSRSPLNRTDHRLLHNEVSNTPFNKIMNLQEDISKLHIMDQDLRRKSHQNRKYLASQTR